MSTFPSGQKGHLNQGSGHTVLHKAAKEEMQLSTVYTETVLLDTEEQEGRGGSLNLQLTPFDPSWCHLTPSFHQGLPNFIDSLQSYL